MPVLHVGDPMSFKPADTQNSEVPKVLAVEYDLREAVVGDCGWRAVTPKVPCNDADVRRDGGALAENDRDGVGELDQDSEETSETRDGHGGTAVDDHSDESLRVVICNDFTRLKLGR